MDPEQEPEIGIDQLIQALPLSERVPAVALKALFDQRNTLDEEQETQLEVVRRKYADKIKPLLDRVKCHLFRQQNSFRVAPRSKKK